MSNEINGFPNFIDPNEIQPVFETSTIDFNQQPQFNNTPEVPTPEFMQPELQPSDVPNPIETIVKEETKVAENIIKVLTEDKVKQNLNNLDFEIQEVGADKTKDEIAIFVNEKYELNNKEALMSIENADFIEMLFGESKFELKKDDQVKDIFSEMSAFKKLGKFIDVYLPVSNIVLRIYEFENNVIKESARNDIVASEYAFTKGNIHSPYGKQFMYRIFDNSVALTSDGENVSRTVLEKLANKDMNLLVLATAVLLLEVGIEVGKIQEDKEAPIKINHFCQSCGAEHEVKVHPRELLRDQYTKAMIDQLDKSYNINGTFETNFKESKLSKIYNVKLENLSNERLIEIKLRESSYIKYTGIEERLNKYILKKWSEHELFKDLVSNNEFMVLSDKDKMAVLIDEAMRNMNINTASSFFITEQICATLMLRIDRIVITNIKTKIVEHNNTMMEMLDKSEEKTFEMIGNLPQTLIDKMTTAINEMDNSSINKIIHKWTCEREECKHVNNSDINPKDLIVFMIAETINNTL